MMRGWWCHVTWLFNSVNLIRLILKKLKACCANRAFYETIQRLGVANYWKGLLFVF